MGLQAVFFDLDGTLLDTASDLINALNKTLEHHQKPTLSLSEARSRVSDGANALLELGFGIDRGSKDILPYRAELLSFYLEDVASETRAFPGILDLISEIKTHNLQWGIVTNKPFIYAEKLMNIILERDSFASQPSCLICPEHVKIKKPDPEALALACEQTGCNVENAIYIGDHIRDIQCGQNANMSTIAATFGYIHENENIADWNADYMVDSAEQIWPIISKLL